MSFLSKRLNSGKKGKSVFDHIKEKNTNPTTESILSFTEREFSRCFADIKFLVENTRFENGYMPFCGIQFLVDDDDDEINNRYQFSLIDADPDGNAIEELKRDGILHLHGNPMPAIADIQDKKEVEKVFNAFADKFYPEYSGYKNNRCDRLQCEICDEKEYMI